MGKFLFGLLFAVLLVANGGGLYLLWEHREVPDQIETIKTDMQTIKTEQAKLIKKIQADRCTLKRDLETLKQGIKALQAIEEKLDKKIEKQIGCAEKCLNDMLTTHNEKSCEQWGEIVKGLKCKIGEHQEKNESCQEIVKAQCCAAGNQQCCAASHQK